MKPYIVTIELQANSLEDAIAQSQMMADCDGMLNGEVVHVYQKYRTTNYGTEWTNKDYKGKDPLLYGDGPGDYKDDL